MVKSPAVKSTANRQHHRPEVVPSLDAEQVGAAIAAPWDVKAPQGSVSGWFANAAQHQLRSEALADALALWEGEFGAIPEVAMTVALKERGARPRKRTKSASRQAG